MLNLHIKLGGDVYIGDNVRIVVKSIDPEQKVVELQFHAPREVKILRGYLYRRREEEQGKDRQSEQ